MKKSRFYAVPLFVFIFIFLLSSVQAQQPVFRIGVLDDTDGTLTKGAALAIRQINEIGGVQGADGTLFRLELVTQFGTSDQLETSVNNLIQANVVAVLGPTDNNTVLANLQLLQSLNTPVIVGASNDSILLSDTTDRIFRMRAAQILHGQVLATYLIQERAVSSITTLQLDINSTDSVVGFSSAAQSLGVTPQIMLLQATVDDLVTAATATNAEAIVAYGSPETAAEILTQLRTMGWTGIFAFDHLTDPAFAENISPQYLKDIISTTAWPLSATDDASDSFMSAYVRTFAEVPDDIAAAAYDTVNLLALAIGQAGELRTNLQAIDNFPGVQGLLRPAQLSPGELSNNVSVVANNTVGVAQVVARYAGGSRLPDDPAIGQPTPPPAVQPTATPDGVTITVTDRAFQNVRSGPSTQFDVLGRLNEGEQARVIGTNNDMSWVVIEFRGQQGWLSTPLLQVFGDLRSVPIIASPPTPTPGATATPAPPQEADIIIESASVSPSPILANQPFNLNVVVRNAGNTDAGNFAIAATMPPNDTYVSTTVSGLAAGQAITVTMSGILMNTGTYSVVVVADLNNQVPEGPGEANNNSFTFPYSIDYPVMNQGTITLSSGSTLDLEGNGVQMDVEWDGNTFNALAATHIGMLNTGYNSVHRDLINGETANNATVPGASLNSGAVIAVRTTDGNRGVIRVDNRSGSDITVTYRLYSN